jgi:hypothetical protein
LLDGIRDSFGKQAGVFDQLDDGQANEFEYVHRVGTPQEGLLEQFILVFGLWSNGFRSAGKSVS